MSKSFFLCELDKIEVWTEKMTSDLNLILASGRGENGGKKTVFAAGSNMTTITDEPNFLSKENLQFCISLSGPYCLFLPVTPWSNKAVSQVVGMSNF